MVMPYLLSWLDRVVERIYGREGEHETCYLTRIKLTPMTRWGGLYLHIFHRGDADPDPHDHPWSFWTLPTQTYLEEVMDAEGRVTLNAVLAWRWQHRRATHVHRVVGPPPCGRGWPLVTLVWHTDKQRSWGFWVHDPVRAEGIRELRKHTVANDPRQEQMIRGDRVFVPWREYVYGHRP